MLHALSKLRPCKILRNMAEKILLDFSVMTPKKKVLQSLVSKTWTVLIKVVITSIVTTLSLM